jgi:hypothetical protein
MPPFFPYFIINRKERTVICVKYYFFTKNITEIQQKEEKQIENSCIFGFRLQILWIVTEPDTKTGTRMRHKSNNFRKLSTGREVLNFQELSVMIIPPVLNG